MCRGGCDAFCTRAVRCSQSRCGLRGRGEHWACDRPGRLFALNSYENRVYQLGDDDGALWVLKFYRPARWSDAQIDEEHAFTLELAAAELPVAAPIERDGDEFVRASAACGSRRFRTSPGARPSSTTSATLTLLGRTLARMHAIGDRERFEHRPALDLERLGVHARASRCCEAASYPRRSTSNMRASANRSSDESDSASTTSGRCRGVRIHGDCHAGNILWRENGPLFVDLDDCMSGPRIQDLWMFLSGDAASQQSSWAAIMEGYELFGEFDFAELTLVEALRVPAHPAPRGVDREPLARPGISARFPVVRRCALLGAAHRGSVRAVVGHGRSAHSFAMSFAQSLVVGLLVLDAEGFLMSRLPSRARLPLARRRARRPACSRLR